MQTITAVPLTQEAFAPFGDVIEINGVKHFSINDGAIERYHDLATVDMGEENDARPLISILSSNSVTSLPAQIKLVERHPLGSQAFVPMCDSPMVVVVALAGETVRVENLHAFVTNGQQGINYRPGIWHMPLVAPKLEQRWLVVDRGGSGNNCDELYFEGDPIYVDVANHKDNAN